MKRIDVIAVGKLSKGPFFDLYEDYKSRLQWSFNLHEIVSKFSNAEAIFKDEQSKIIEKLDPHAFLIVLDERGNGLRSLDFAKTLENLNVSGENYVQFVIGGADGLGEEIKSRANMLLSFGQQTWPHMMARVMLMEQIYRAQQIMSGHPYHRE